VYDSLDSHYILRLFQAELEHCTPKSRYKRTSKKNYRKQLTQIERRQARVRQIRSRLNAGKASRYNEVEYASSSMPQYCIGKSQNQPVILSIFLQENRGDPAVKVSNVSGLLSLYSKVSAVRTSFPD
jgi:hypothetical protein